MTLADKIEALTGPDREVDVEIALATGLVLERDGDCFFGHRDYSMLVLERDYYDHGGHAPELPHFTASLDAAMTLYEVVPDMVPSCPRKACAAALRATQHTSASGCVG